MKPIILSNDLLAEARSFFEECGTKGCEGTALTARDVRSGNEDLLEAAGPLLVRARAHTLAAEVERRGETVAVDITTTNLERVDAVVDNRPAASPMSHPGGCRSSSRDGQLPANGWSSPLRRATLSRHESSISDV